MVFNPLVFLLTALIKSLPSRFWVMHSLVHIDVLHEKLTWIMILCIKLSNINRHLGKEKVQLVEGKRFSSSESSLYLSVINNRYVALCVQALQWQCFYFLSFRRWQLYRDIHIYKTDYFFLNHLPHAKPPYITHLYVWTTNLSLR